jgi:hypothetical protein
MMLESQISEAYSLVVGAIKKKQKSGEIAIILSILK